VNGSLFSMAVILAVLLVVLGVAAVKNEELRTKLVGVALGLVGALAAIVAVLTVNREKKRAGEVAASTKEVKTGRVEAKEDSLETERSLDIEVAKEEDTHKEAVGEQEDLKEMKRERLKA